MKNVSIAEQLEKSGLNKAQSKGWVPLASAFCTFAYGMLSPDTQMEVLEKLVDFVVLPDDQFFVVKPELECEIIENMLDEQEQPKVGAEVAKQNPGAPFVCTSHGGKRVELGSLIVVADAETKKWNKEVSHHRDFATVYRTHDYEYFAIYTNDGEFGSGYLLLKTAIADYS